MSQGKRPAGEHEDAPTLKRQSVEPGVEPGVEQGVERHTPGIENTRALTFNVGKAALRVHNALGINTDTVQFATVTMIRHTAETIQIDMEQEVFRELSIEIMLSVCIHFSVSCNTYCLALRLMDVWMQRVTWRPEQEPLQNSPNKSEMTLEHRLTATAFFMIACKHVESYTPTVRHLLQYIEIDHSYHEFLVRKEVDILFRLEWNVNIMTALDWIDIILGDVPGYRNMNNQVSAQCLLWMQKSQKNGEGDEEEGDGGNEADIKRKCLFALSQHKSSRYGDLWTAIDVLTKANVLTEKDVKRMPTPIRMFEGAVLVGQ